MADVDAAGNVGNPDDKYLPADTNLAGSGWNSIWGFLDGIRGVTDRAESITGDYAGIVDKLTAADRTKWELKADKKEFDQDQQLEWLTTERGDNKIMMYVAGAVALGAVVLLVGK